MEKETKPDIIANYISLHKEEQYINYTSLHILFYRALKNGLTWKRVEEL